MKKLTFILFAALAWAACQNSESDNKAESPESAVSNSLQSANPGQTEAASMEKVLSDAQASLDETKNVSKQIDALPEKIKKEKATEIEEMRNMVEAITEKQTYFMQELNASKQAAAPKTESDGGSSFSGSQSSTGGPDPALLKDAAESNTRYQEELKKIQEQIKTLKDN